MKLGWRAMLGWLLLAGILLLGSAVVAAQFTVHPGEPLGPPLVGYGVEMSPYLTAPNLGQPVGDLTDLERKLKALAPQHVRIFVLTQWWEPGQEKMRNSFIRTCRLAQSVGATINVTLWHGWNEDPGGSSKAMAGLLQDLVCHQSLSAVRYVTLQNEVNRTRLTMAAYNDFYRRFDKDLRELGLREQFRIIGGDLLRYDEAGWFQNLATNLAEVCDGYSVHMYWDYPQVANYLPERFGEIGAIQQQLPAAARRPLYITEFGARGQDWHVRGNEPGFYKDGTPLVQSGTYALEMAWLMAEATRRGYVATVQWEAYDVAYPRNRMHYGLLGEASQGWPRRPSYQVLSLFTHTVLPGWRAVQVEGNSAAIALGAVQGPKGELTVLALNHSTAPQAISLLGLPKGMVFERLQWEAADKDRLVDAGRVGAEAGELELKLPAQSLTALTAGLEKWKKLASVR